MLDDKKAHLMYPWSQIFCRENGAKPTPKKTLVKKASHNVGSGDSIKCLLTSPSVYLQLLELERLRWHLAPSRR